ncbi:MAG: hypothetical protein KJ015_09825 [Myxococcales bacterium]|nr:hypothetical protein [Myxococcales bacterium]
MERFAAFVAEAQTVRPGLRCERFEDFVKLAGPMATRHLRRYVERSIPAAQLLRAWLVAPEHDLLAVAGFRMVEDAYTELMAWAIDEDRGSELARRLQVRWLSDIGISHPAFSTLVRPLRVTTQLGTDDGVPDLVLSGEGMLVVVEAKTGSAEHTTPTSGRMQTEAYLDATRKKLGLSPDALGWTIFITPHRVPAASPDALPTTYIQFALSLASALADLEVSGALRLAYAMLITHLVDHAKPMNSDVRAVTTWLAELGASSGVPDAQILGRAELVHRFAALIGTPEAR